MRYIGHMICWIGYWEYVSGVIQIIRTNKTIVYIVKSLYLVGLVRLLVFCSPISYLVASSSASPTTNGLIMVWGGWVLVRYIWGVTKLNKLSASPLEFVYDSIYWEFSCCRNVACPVHWFWAGVGTLMVGGIPSDVWFGV